MLRAHTGGPVPSDVPAKLWELPIGASARRGVRASVPSQPGVSRCYIGSSATLSTKVSPR